MKKLILIFCFLFLNYSLTLKAQEGFHLVKKNAKKQRVSFKLINNLIVIPVYINNKELSFILDSGVTKTILFNISENDSLELKNVTKVKLQGLGKGEPVDALISKNNKLKLKGIVSNNETIHIVLKDYFDLSAKMGTTIHGIIGYNILRNFIVKINYRTKKIDFFNPAKFSYKKCRKCEVFPMRIHKKKPFINAQVQLDTVGENLTDVKLLIDSGGSDALWLFEDTKENIKTPNKYFKDILGEGLSGMIYGNRSRIPLVKLKSFELEKPTVSFLDALSTHNARSFKERNGSIGAGILKRFIVWFDYPNNKLTLKKNGSFTKGFDYNMSGLDVMYNGKQLVREEDTKQFVDSYDQSVSNNNSVSFITSFSFKFKPSYIINGVIKGSSAAKAGLLKGDILLKINNTPVHKFTLNKINYKLSEKDGKKVHLTIDRNGTTMKFIFKLERRI